MLQRVIALTAQSAAASTLPLKAAPSDPAIEQTTEDRDLYPRGHQCAQASETAQNPPSYQTRETAQPPSRQLVAHTLFGVPWRRCFEPAAHPPLQVALDPRCKLPCPRARRTSGEGFLRVPRPCATTYKLCSCRYQNAGMRSIKPCPPSRHSDNMHRRNLSWNRGYHTASKHFCRGAPC